MSQAGVGRPRDPDYDARILTAAAHVFAERGWTGFTFDRVAREAGIGKPSVYRRWPSRQSLLFAALQIRPLEYKNLGSLREDLTEVLHQIFRGQATETGVYWLRMLADAHSLPELMGFYQEQYLSTAISVFAELGAQSIARGEISRMPPINFLMEMAVGPITMRLVHSTFSERLLAQEDHYVDRLAEWMANAIISEDAAADLRDRTQ
jgi:AcrR family transcriptional regulator